MWFLLACSTEAPAPTVPTTEPVPIAARATRGDAVEQRGPIARVTGITITPERPVATDTLQASPSTENASPAARFDFTWYINGEDVYGAITDTLQPGVYKRGDKVKVDVSMEDNGVTATFTGKDIEIANIPPRMLTKPNQLTRIDGFIMKAEDPDGEPLTWQLTGAPAGMEINERGVMSYRGTAEEPGGTYTVRIVARDTGGDEVGIDLPLDISPGSVALAKKKAEEEEANRQGADTKKEELPPRTKGSSVSGFGMGTGG